MLAVEPANSDKIWVPDDPKFTLGPPYIMPVFECSESVAVQALPNAAVEVFGSMGVLGVGQAGRNGVAQVYLTKPLERHQEIAAIQKSNGEVSPQSYPRIVEEYRPPTLPKLRVFDEVYECGEVVSSYGVVPGPRLFLEMDTEGKVISEALPTSSRDGWWPITHNHIPKGSLPTRVRTQQVHCPKTEREIIGPPSEWRDVLPAPSPMPDVVNFEAYAGTDTMWVHDTLLGSRVEAFQNSHLWSQRYSTYHQIGMTGDVPIEEGAKMTVVQTLCESSKPKEVEARPLKDLQNLPPPQILKPLCPKTRIVRVTTSLPGGYVRLMHNGQIISVTWATDSVTSLPLPSNLELKQGDVLEAHQVFVGTSQGNIQTGVSTATVDATSKLEVLEAQVYTNQNTGNDIEGFVRETSRGPVFALNCCADCDPGKFAQCYEGQQPEPRRAKIEIKKDGGTVDSVVLVEESPGYFVGRWDWFMTSGATNPWPPRAGYDYVAEVVESPCKEDLESPINVLIGEVNLQDWTPPEIARLTLSQPGGPTLIVNGGEPSTEFSVLPGREINLQLLGFDSDGMSTVELSADPASKLEPPTIKTSDPNHVPIPAELLLKTKVKELWPYETVTIFAQVSSFGITTVLPHVKIKADHVFPSINGLTSAVYSNESITISGEHLRYPTLETTVHFSLQQSGQPPLTAIVPITDTNGSPTAISLPVPAAFVGKRGTVDVFVKTKDANGSHEVTSSTMSFELRDRVGPFQKIDGTGFTLAQNRTCSSSDAGTITSVTVEAANCGGMPWRATIYSEGRQPYVECFNTVHAGPGVADLGGVAVFDVSCRNVAILSHSGGFGHPPAFQLIWFYFPESGAPVSKTVDNVSLHYKSTNGQSHYVPHVLNAFASRDGTVAVNSTPVVYQGGTPNINVNGSLFDMLDNSHQPTNTEMSGVCIPGQLCSISATLNTNLAELNVNSATIGSWTLQ